MEEKTTRDIFGDLSVSTAFTDQHKDHTHQEPERAELNNSSREGTSHGTPGAGSDSDCPASSTGFWEICSVSSTGGYGASAKAAAQPSEELLHRLPLAPTAGGSFPPSFPMAHPCSASLPAASATPNLQQFCQPTPSTQGRPNQEDDITTGGKKQQKTPNQTKPHNNHRSTIIS